MIDDARAVIAGKIVDMDDGSTRDPNASEVFWCDGPENFYQSVPYNASDTGTDVRVDRKSLGLAALCSKDGDTLRDTDPSGTGRGPSPAALPLAYSTPTDTGLRIVSFEDRIVAYEVPR